MITQSNKNHRITKLYYFWKYPQMTSDTDEDLYKVDTSQFCGIKHAVKSEQRGAGKYMTKCLENEVHSVIISLFNLKKFKIKLEDTPLVFSARLSRQIYWEEVGRSDFKIGCFFWWTLQEQRDIRRMCCHFPGLPISWMNQSAPSVSTLHLH